MLVKVIVAAIVLGLVPMAGLIAIDVRMQLNKLANGDHEEEQASI